MGKIKESMKKLIEDATTLRNIDKQELAKAMGMTPQNFANLQKRGSWKSVHIEKLCSFLKIELWQAFSDDWNDSDDAVLHRKLQNILESRDDDVIRCIHRAISAFEESLNRKTDNLMKTGDELRKKISHR
jgi:DNA-binding Xre family transcriptional regulator